MRIIVGGRYVTRSGRLVRITGTSQSAAGFHYCGAEEGNWERFWWNLDGTALDLPWQDTGDDLIEPAVL